MKMTKKMVLLGFACYGSLVAQPVRTDSTLAKKGNEPAAATPSAAPAASDFGIKFSGFLRHDAAYDSRQVIGARESSVLLWPRDITRDADGKDINAAPNFQMLAIISRLTGNITGPDVMGAKTSGILEAEFFGNTEASINEFRLRHAWIKLDWKNTQLGLGQYWNPMTLMDCYAGVVNFNTGAPFMPFNRNPQIRLTQKIGSFNVILAAVSQRDFSSNTEAYRNSALPAAHAQLQYKTEKFVAGVAGHFEQLRPKISGTIAPGVTKASNERVNSASFIAYVKVITKPVLIRAEAFMGQNASSFVMLGGFAGYTLPGQIETYQTMNTTSAWIDLVSNHKKIAPGLFIGYTENNGTSKFVEGATVATYGLSSALGAVAAGTGRRTIQSMYRISPRIEFLLKKLKFGVELECTIAEWGDAENNGTVKNNKVIAENYRGIFATTYTF